MNGVGKSYAMTGWEKLGVQAGPKEIISAIKKDTISNLHPNPSSISRAAARRSIKWAAKFYQRKGRSFRSEKRLCGE